MPRGLSALALKFDGCPADAPSDHAADGEGSDAVGVCVFHVASLFFFPREAYPKASEILGGLW